ncbi:endonuclease/exonuclease/phosphatase family protein [Lysobacter silvisoli]|uniref:Endonuclease/exonuclease/phosphatase family protein n=1 Tax=Lysobacter silvisoli TaxID=2293254 RepID=A0A371K2R1_9GAMM|nr:endonuclease/exonuclease/phosphatase family protein [Lysobacter silvisoli]RDZ28150.1 endonuclease/exonuclease/phosphatase family protein [Lysobacter silvisoli]
MELRLMWWNAGLSPGKGPKASGDKQQAALAVVNGLIQTHRADLFGLCEVSEADIVRLSNEFGPKGFGIVPIQDKDGQAQFDMCLLYKIDTLAFDLTSKLAAFDMRSKSKIKVGFAIQAVLLQNGEKISIVASHWPSRMQRAKDHVSRIEMSTALRDLVEQKRQEGWGRFVLMGDYNDEPYDTNLFNVLCATRDHAFASKRKDYFYNPFWRHLTGQPYDASSTNHALHGTFQYAASHEPQQSWWLFDQMMFSSEFVGEGPWHLREEDTGVANISRQVYDYTPKPTFPGKLTKSQTLFDHLPIYSTLERI